MFYFKCCIILLSFGTLSVLSATVNYKPVSINVAVNNPERGFYVSLEVSSLNYQKLVLSDLIQYKSQNITIVLREFYLEAFVKSSISASYLNNMQADFNTIRQSGLKCLVRFAYSADNTEGLVWDASKSQVLTHIKQVKNILNANSDIIFVVQTGFVGVWGEWYYTNNFGYPDITPTDIQNRKDVVNALLEAVPDTRMIQIRTPALKRSMTGRVTALTKNEAYKNTSVARIGHHNDCFLASSDDLGTYENISVDYPYLAQETLYTPMGGETCAVNLPRSGCQTALNELEKFHWTYLNSEYHEKVIAGFKKNGCYNTIQNRLGYRFELIKGIFPDVVKRNVNFTVQIVVNNTGFATPFNKRVVYLVFRHLLTNVELQLPLKTDLRLWASGKQTIINESLMIPKGLPLGIYKLFLNLPDANQTIRTRPDYSIRFANNGLWEAKTGYNSLLHTIILN